MPAVNYDWFLNRKLDNLDFIKELSEKELNRCLLELDPVPVFYTKPFKHQRALFLLCQQYDQILIFADLGTGKSWVILNDITYKKLSGKLDKPALFVTPDVINTNNILEQVSLHTPHLKAVGLIGHKQERLKALMQPADLFIINYTGLQVLLSDGSVKDKNGKTHRGIDTYTIKEFASRFSYVTFDEITFLKNARSLNYKVCNTLSDSIKYRYGLTGTPLGRDSLDLWSQFMTIDKGATLSNNFFLYRAIFFKERKTYFASIWKLDDKKKDILHTTLKNRSIRYSAEECVDLPERIHSTIRVDLLDEAKEYYNKIVRNIIDSKTDKWAATIKNHFIKLRQICSGFLLYRAEDDESGNNQVITFKCEKDQVLEQLLTNLPDNHKMLIFHEYIKSGERITGILKKLKIEHRWIWGGSKDNSGAIEEFKQNTKLRVLVLNAHSGSYGLNLQVANFVVYYEAPLSPIVREQSLKRAHRTGQTKTVYVYDLVTNKSIEEKIMFYLQEGKNLFSELIEGKFKVEELLNK